jgi:hypothetical protein
MALYEMDQDRVEAKNAIVNKLCRALDQFNEENDVFDFDVKTSMCEGTIRINAEIQAVLKVKG